MFYVLIDSRLIHTIDIELNSCAGTYYYLPTERVIRSSVATVAASLFESCHGYKLVQRLM